MKCPHCRDELIRKKEHDTYIPLGLVRVYYCEAGNQYYAYIPTYDDIQNDTDTGG